MDEVIGDRVEGKHAECGPKVPKNVRIAGSAQKHAKMCKELGIKLLRLGSVKVDKCYVQFDLSSYCPFPIVLSGGSSYV